MLVKDTQEVTNGGLTLFISPDVSPLKSLTIFYNNLSLSSIKINKEKHLNTLYY